MSIKVGKLVTTGSATESVTGLGFQPTALILFGHLRSANGGAGPGVNDGISMGFCTDTVQAFFSHRSNGNVDNHYANRGYDQIHAYVRDRVVGRYNLSSFDSDGFTLENVDTQNGIWIFYIAIKAPNANIVHINRPGATGNQSYTGVGFEPDVMFTIHGYKAADMNSEADARGGFGWAQGVGDAQMCWDVYDDHGAGAVDARTSYHSGEVINVSNGTRAEFVSFDSDGFTLNWTEVGAPDYPISVLCLKGLEVYASEMSWPSDLTDQSITGFGFEPQTVLFVGSHHGESAKDAWVTNLGIAFGAASGPTEQCSIGYEMRDLSSVASDPTTWTYDDKALSLWYNQNVQEIMDFVSLDADGFTYHMDDSGGGEVINYIGLRIVEPEFRDSLIQCRHNTYHSRHAGRVVLQENFGRRLPPEQMETDKWVFSGGIGWPSPEKREFLLEDPNAFYSESVSPQQDSLTMETDRESFFETVMRRLGRG